MNVRKQEENEIKSPDEMNFDELGRDETKGKWICERDQYKWA